jgi:lysophospholipase L1-like esterase
MLRFLRAFAIVALPLAAGCYDDERLEPADLSNNNGLFQRYAAIGTSISSGLQSGGINDSTQRQSFTFLVARQANGGFNYPRLFGRGCPAPLTNNVNQTRVGGASAAGCDLRYPPLPTSLNNVAVPGLNVVDIFDNNASPLSTYERLQTFFLGGQTPWNALRRAQPTVITIEVGSNDVLGGVTSRPNPGNPDSVTPAPEFIAAYEEFADSVDALGATVVAFTIPDVTSIPFASTGTVYWCLKTGLCGQPAAPFPPTFTVSNNCAPNAAIPGSKGDSILVPWTIGVAGLLGAANPAGPVPFALDCANDQLVVTPAEYGNLRNTTETINDYIVQTAADRGWLLADANAILAALRASGAVPPFPDIAPALTGGSVGFGPYFSLDGFHPSACTHQVVANAVIDLLNTERDTEIPSVDPIAGCP